MFVADVPRTPEYRKFHRPMTAYLNIGGDVQNRTRPCRKVGLDGEVTPGGRGCICRESICRGAWREKPPLRESRRRVISAPEREVLPFAPAVAASAALPLLQRLVFPAGGFPFQALFGLVAASRALSRLSERTMQPVRFPAPSFRVPQQRGQPHIHRRGEPRRRLLPVHPRPHPHR